MEALGFVEEIAQADHQQEHAAEGQDARLGQLEQVVIVVGMVQGGIEGRGQADAAGQADQQQGAEEAHAEDRDHQAPGEEKPLLARGQPIEDAGINHGVVKGEADLQGQQHAGNPDGLPTLDRRHHRETRETQSNGKFEVAKVLLHA